MESTSPVLRCWAYNFGGPLTLRQVLKFWGLEGGFKEGAAWPASSVYRRHAGEVFIVISLFYGVFSFKGWNSVYLT